MRQPYTYTPGIINMLPGILQSLAMSKKAPKPERRRTYIKEWREQRGWSQEDLADMAGVTQETVSRLENAVHGYTQDTMERLAAAMGVTVGKLTDHDPTKDSVLVQLARRIRPEDLDQVRGILEGFVKKRA